MNATDWQTDKDWHGREEIVKCHMDNFNEVLLPFWASTMVVVLLSMEGQKAHGFLKNILICAPKMNEGLAGLERHEDE